MMIYLLGGPPRVGKTIIADKIRKKLSINCLSTDSLGAALEKIIGPKEAPDLFIFRIYNKLSMVEKTNVLVKDPKKHIESIRKESQIIWKAMEGFIQKELEENRDILIEGVAVLPELVNRLNNMPRKAIFLGNRGKNHGVNITNAINHNADDWMKGASGDYILAYAMFVNIMSKYIESESKKYGFTYIELSKIPFGEVSGRVLNAFVKEK